MCVCVCVCVCVIFAYIYMCICVCEREREKERESFNQTSKFFFSNSFSLNVYSVLSEIGLRPKITYSRKNISLEAIKNGGDSKKVVHIQFLVNEISKLCKVYERMWAIFGVACFL